MATEQRLVVLVDDDSSIRQSLARLFKNAGLKFIAFESAEDALRSNSLNSAGCLIADVRMPQMQGLEFQQVCREKWPSLRTIMISAYNDDDAQARAIKAGAIAFLHKPFDPMGLLNLVSEAIEIQNPHRRKNPGSHGERGVDAQRHASIGGRKRAPPDRQNKQERG